MFSWVIVECFAAAAFSALTVALITPDEPSVQLFAHQREIKLANSDMKFSCSRKNSDFVWVNSHKLIKHLNLIFVFHATVN